MDGYICRLGHFGRIAAEVFFMRRPMRGNDAAKAAYGDATSSGEGHSPARLCRWKKILNTAEKSGVLLGCARKKDQR